MHIETGVTLVETFLAAVVTTRYEGSKGGVQPADINIHHEVSSLNNVMK